jgi:Cu/Ag efflux protein CusF
MKHLPALTLLGLLAVGGHAPAQDTSNEHAAHHPATPASASTSNTTEAKVRKVDTAAGKITLQHGEIKNLGMAAMTMVYRVKNPALLNELKAGDQVQFTADRINGVFTVLSIEPVK